MSKPLLTVCLITYNQAAYIRQSVDSILSQSLKVDWQLVIADDHSTDGTREILEEYRKRDPNHVKLILQPKNVGPEANWLDLLAYPKTKYVLYAEGDDYFTDQNKLQKQLDFLETHKEYSICFHPVEVIYEGISKENEKFPSAEFRYFKTKLDLNDLIKRNFIQTNSAMYRWRFINEDVKSIFPKNIAPGDWFLHILHAETGYIGYIDEVMSVYRRHKNGIWWESVSNNLDNIWRKYGILHIRLYVEMLKLNKLTKNSKAIIQTHIRDVVYALSEIDEKYKETLVKEMVNLVPESIEPFIIISSKDFKHQTNEIKELRAELQDLQEKYAANNDLLRKSEAELTLINASRIWKLRNKLAIFIGR